MGEEEKIDKKVDESQLTPVDSAMHYASSIQVISNSNQFDLVFFRNIHFRINRETRGEPVGSGVKVESIISLSPQTAKDLQILLEGQIRQYEKAFGKINTSFSMTSPEAE